MENKIYNITLLHVIEAIIEKGYNPYAQLRGYVLEKNPLYITSYKSAREIIKTIDIKYIDEYLRNWETYQDKKWIKEFIDNK